MQKLTRIRTTAAIHSRFRGRIRVDSERELLLNQRKIRLGMIEKHSFPSHWRVTKNQLLKESYNKCAYCETPTSVVAYGDVEHYRPKSKYWWLAYCYDNYLASCTLCNQKYKKANFRTLHAKMRGPSIRINTTDRFIEDKAGSFTPDPLNDGEGLPLNDFVDAHKSERPLLLNPYIDDPQEYFVWEVDIDLTEVTLAPKPSNPMANKFLEAAEVDYGINRKELRDLRFDIYLSYSTHRLTAEDDRIPHEVRERNRRSYERMIRPEGAYSGMLKYFESLPSDQLP